jgi:hypothetical protein
MPGPPQPATTPPLAIPVLRSVKGLLGSGKRTLTPGTAGTLTGP